MLSKIKTLSQLKPLVSQAKAEGRRVVFTNGCFDLLHVGHVRYLAQAKACGDMLIVAVNSDASVRNIKGKLRPLVPQEERAQMLAALEMVDCVLIFEELDPARVIQELQPHVLVKGGDWAADKIIGREIVEAAGGAVVLIPPIAGAGTSEIIKRIVARYGGDKDE